MTLPRLPGRDEEDQPLTLDLNGRVCVCVRARAAGQSRTTEVVLARSECTGEPARLCLNRQHLARALRLGLVDAYVVKPTSPVLFRDDRRKYVVMPLPPAGALAPAEDALRIESAEPTLRILQPDRIDIPMATPSSNGHENGHTIPAATWNRAGVTVRDRAGAAPRSKPSPVLPRRRATRPAAPARSTGRRA